VHNWILQRIPEEHQHLVEDVKEGDIKDLLDEVFGLAARSTPQSPAVLQGCEAEDRLAPNNALQHSALYGDNRRVLPGKPDAIHSGALPVNPPAYGESAGKL
jgi:hypothetical protein